jgi:hypothetical protein
MHTNLSHHTQSISTTKSKYKYGKQLSPLISRKTKEEEERKKQHNAFLKRREQLKIIMPSTKQPTKKNYLEMYQQHKDYIKHEFNNKISWQDINQQNYERFLLESPAQQHKEYELNSVLFAEQIDNSDSEEEELLKHLMNKEKCSVSIRNKIEEDMKQQQITEIPQYTTTTNVLSSKYSSNHRKVQLNGIPVEKITSNQRRTFAPKGAKNIKQQGSDISNISIINVNEHNDVESGGTQDNNNNNTNSIIHNNNRLDTQKKLYTEAMKRNNYYQQKFDTSHKHAEDAQQNKVISVIHKLEKKRIKLKM